MDVLLFNKVLYWGHMSIIYFLEGGLVYIYLSRKLYFHSLLFDCLKIMNLKWVPLKGHWTSVTSSPNFFQKRRDFYTIRSFGMDND